MSSPSADGLLTPRFRAARRLSLADEVYENLKSLILDHVLPPAARLNIDSLTRELDTSATPIREALARLESDGLVARQALRGYSVAPVLTTEGIAELYELRLLIEPWAAARAAERAEGTGLAALTAELHSVRDVPEGESHDAYREFSAHDERLHRAVLSMAGNETVRQVFERSHPHLHLYRVVYGKELGMHAEDEHASIVAAISAGDAAGAERAMRSHLELARDRLAGGSGGAAEHS